jgi:hypothetical protein
MSNGVICNCSRPTHHDPAFVVVTGGPSAGKTAILEVARQHVCEHVAVLPEAAGIVFGGGFWRKDSLAAKKAAQRAIYHIQSEFERMIREERQVAMVLCDRGTLDGVAYWPEAEESFWSELNTSRADELKRYRAVIHLRTPSIEHGYNVRNPLRIESAAQAVEVDSRILRAWEGHPKRLVLDSREDFLEKARKAVELIRNEMPVCCRTHRFPEFES